MQMNPGAEPPSDKLRLYAFHCGREIGPTAPSSIRSTPDVGDEDPYAPYFFYLVPASVTANVLFGFCCTPECAMIRTAGFGRRGGRDRRRDGGP